MSCFVREMFKLTIRAREFVAIVPEPALVAKAR